MIAVICLIYAKLHEVHNLAFFVVIIRLNVLAKLENALLLCMHKATLAQPLIGCAVFYFYRPQAFNWESTLQSETSQHRYR